MKSVTNLGSLSKNISLPKKTCSVGSLKICKKTGVQIIEFAEPWAENIQFKVVDTAVYYRRIYDNNTPGSESAEIIRKFNPPPPFRVFILPLMFSMISAFSLLYRIHQTILVDV